MCLPLASDNVLQGNPLYRLIYDAAGAFLPCWLAYLVAGLVIMLILVNMVLMGAGLFSWVERRLLGRFQNRLGPNRWGPFGILHGYGCTTTAPTPSGTCRVGRTLSAFDPWESAYLGRAVNWM